MRDAIIILILIIAGIWGYRLMGKLDRFLDAHAMDDEGDGK